MSLRYIQIPTQITALWSDLPPIEDVVDLLPKVQSWDTLKGKKNIVRGVWDGTYHSGLRKPEDIDTIVIHHAPPDAALETHARNHGKNWGAGLAYHIAIDQGRIKQANDLLSFTFHAGGNNTYTIGIVVNADLSKRSMTEWERKLLYAAILTVKSILPIKYILGHKEVPENNTVCPCIDLDKVREDIATLEHRLVAVNTWAAKVNQVNELANQYTYMFGLLQAGESDGNAAWAMQNLLDVREVLKGKGLL